MKMEDGMRESPQMIVDFEELEERVATLEKCMVQLQIKIIKEMIKEIKHDNRIKE